MNRYALWYGTHLPTATADGSDENAPAESPARPKRAMMLAAGLGKRMRPITATVPKPLVEVGGRALIDHALDRLRARRGGAAATCRQPHACRISCRRRRPRPKVVISDETAKLLDTGGGIDRRCRTSATSRSTSSTRTPSGSKGRGPTSIGSPAPGTTRGWTSLLLLAPTVRAIGYRGRGDFRMDTTGRLTRRREREVVPFAYCRRRHPPPPHLRRRPDGAFSLNLLFDKAAEAERLFGVRMDGLWLHVGTPEAIGEAEMSIADSAA